MGAALSDATSALDSWFPAGRDSRHPAAPDWPMANRAPWPAIYHREPAWRRQQYWSGGSREVARGWLHTAYGNFGERHQCHPLRQAQLQLDTRHRPDSEPHPGPARYGGQPISTSKDGAGIYRL